jgi:acyl transferase domain-containing protein
MILEEYLPPARPAPAEPRPQLVVLSAQNPARLTAAAQQLLELARRAAPDLSFDDAIFTLQTGREAFDQRLAFVADDWARLAAQLEKFLGSPSPGDDFYVGNARAPGLHPAALLQDSAPERAFIRELFATGRWGKLAAFWVSGSEIDWAELQANGAARRVPLPTYPFAQVRCWFEASAPDARPGAGASPAAGLHPLLDTNLSTLHEVRFGKVFRATEEVLRDHVVAGQSVLPGVAYLEMVRAAAARARERPVTAVSNIVWMRPLVVADTPVATFVSLVPQGERLDWEIWTQPAGERIVHARGRIAEDSPTGDAPMQFDLARLTAQCTATFDRTTLYRDFASRGLQYGPGLQTITQLWLGPGEALARLELPPGSGRTDDDWWPSGLLDGALQTIAGLNAGSQEGGLLLPFALRRLRGQGRLPDQCYALARPSAVANGQAEVRKFDVHLLDDAGNLLLSLEECAFRAIRTDRPAPPGAPTPPPIAAASPDPESALPPAALNRLLHQLASRQIGWEEASRATRIEHLAPPTASRPRP